MEVDKIKEFELYLMGLERSQNTIDSYMRSMMIFFEKYSEVNKENMIDFKKWLMEEKNLKLRITGWWQ